MDFCPDLPVNQHDRRLRLQLVRDITSCTRIAIVRRIRTGHALEPDRSARLK